MFCVQCLKKQKKTKGNDETPLGFVSVRVFVYVYLDRQRRKTFAFSIAFILHVYEKELKKNSGK